LEFVEGLLDAAVVAGPDDRNHVMALSAEPVEPLGHRSIATIDQYIRDFGKKFAELVDRRLDVVAVFDIAERGGEYLEHPRRIP
jgi:hypothetical protein